LANPMSEHSTTGRESKLTTATVTACRGGSKDGSEDFGEA